MQQTPKYIVKHHSQLRFKVYGSIYQTKDIVLPDRIASLHILFSR